MRLYIIMVTFIFHNLFKQFADYVSMLLLFAVMHSNY